MRIFLMALTLCLMATSSHADRIVVDSVSIELAALSLDRAGKKEIARTEAIRLNIDFSTNEFEFVVKRIFIKRGTFKITKNQLELYGPAGDAANPRGSANYLMATIEQFEKKLVLVLPGGSATGRNVTEKEARREFAALLKIAGKAAAAKSVFAHFTSGNAKLVEATTK